jgi:hypothetical protein
MHIIPNQNTVFTKRSDQRGYDILSRTRHQFPLWFGVFFKLTAEYTSVEQIRGARK